MKAKVRTGIEEALREVIPKEAASDFNQGLIEIGAIVCVPNGAPPVSYTHLDVYKRQAWSNPGGCGNLL